MLKFLRKYNKFILVIGGALLMVAFLMPQAIQQLGQDQSGREFMRIDGRKVTEGDAERAERRRFVVRSVSPFSMMQLGIEDRVEHWMLLVHEANRHGLIGGAQDGRDFIGDLAEFQAFLMLQQQFGDNAQMIMQQFGAQFMESYKTAARENIEAARTRLGVRPEEFDLALAELHGIYRLRNLYDGGPGRVSDRRAVAEGLKLHNQARVDYVFVPAATVLDQVPQPDDETLARHLEHFRDLRPGEGEFGIGYLLPPRVKLEWLKLDREAIAASVRVDRMDIAQRYMRNNPGAAASGPEFDAVRPVMEEQLRKETTDRIMSEADQAVRAEFARVIRRLDSEGPYRVLPANWDELKPDLMAVRDAVVQRVRSQTGRTIGAPPVTVMNAAWHTADDLRRLPGIGVSTMQRGGRPMPFAEAALSVRELEDRWDLGLQVGVPGAVTTDAAGNQYYFTVLDARPESAPESIDEIRDRLVQDYRKLEAFKVLQREADIYRQRAVNEGLESLAAPLPANFADMPTPGTVAELRRGAALSRSGQVRGHPALAHEDVKKAIVAAAEGLDPTVEASTVPVEHRTLVVPAPRELGLVVARVEAFRPMTEELFRQMDRGLVQQFQLDASATAEDDPFTLARIADRLNAKLPARRSGGES